MNKSTEILIEEHRHILRMIKIMQKLYESKTLNIDHLEIAIDFIRNYADEFHHGKEELILFPLLKLRGFSFRQGVVALLFTEHDMGRNHIQYIAVYSMDMKNGRLGSLSKLMVQLKSFVDLLGRHITKEDNLFFPLVDESISEADDDLLYEQFMQFDQKSEQKEKCAQALFQLEQLSAIYL